MNCFLNRRRLNKNACRSIWTVLHWFDMLKNATKTKLSSWNTKNKMMNYDEQLFQEKRKMLSKQTNGQVCHRCHSCCEGRGQSLSTVLYYSSIPTGIQWIIFPKISHKLPFMQLKHFSTEGNCFSHSSFDTFHVMCATHMCISTHISSKQMEDTPIDRTWSCYDRTTDFHNIPFFPIFEYLLFCVWKLFSIVRLHCFA